MNNEKNLTAQKPASFPKTFPEPGSRYGLELNDREYRWGGVLYHRVRSYNYPSSSVSVD